MTTEDTNDSRPRRQRVSAAIGRVKRTVTGPLHRSPRPSLPTPAAQAFVGPDGRSYWLLARGQNVAVLVDEPGVRPEVFDLPVSVDDQGRLQATADRADEPAAVVPVEQATAADEDAEEEAAAPDAA